MITSSIVSIYTRTAAVGTEGERTYSYVYTATVFADVQPKALSSVQVESWGISDIAQDAKAMYYSKGITVPMLARVKFENKYYEVRSVNQWPTHNEAILIPEQGL